MDTCGRKQGLESWVILLSLFSTFVFSKSHSEYLVFGVSSGLLAYQQGDNEKLFEKKYLGDIISSGLKSMKNITDKTNKGVGNGN